jgi:addiction module RelE/StbE family toxin
MRVVWSKESLYQLAEIEAFIAQDNDAMALKFTDLIFSRSLIIEQNPLLGRIVPEFNRPEIRELIIEGYRLVYKIDKEKINILTVFEGHRLIKRSDILRDQKDA